MTLRAVLERFADDPTERVKAVDRFVEEHGDPRFRENAWFLPDEPRLGFVEVPAGPFSMGSDPERDSSAYDDETPQHEVTLPAYYVARYPVTVAQFRAHVEDAGRTPEDPESLRGPASHPVVHVSWQEVMTYGHWLREKLGASNEAPADLRRLVRGAGVERPWHVMLPNEAEWEKPARGHRRSHLSVEQRGRYESRQLRRHAHQPDVGSRLLPRRCQSVRCRGVERERVGVDPERLQRLSVRADR